MLLDRRELVSEAMKKIIKISRSIFCKKFSYIFTPFRYSEGKQLSTHATCFMLSAKVHREKINGLKLLLSLKIINNLNEFFERKIHLR